MYTSDQLPQLIAYLTQIEEKPLPQLEDQTSRAS